MTALRFQTGGRPQTSLASLQGTVYSNAADGRNKRITWLAMVWNMFLIHEYGQVSLFGTSKLSVCRLLHTQLAHYHVSKHPFLIGQDKSRMTGN